MGSILQHRLTILKSKWDVNELLWMPVQPAKETEEAAIMTLGQRLGFESEEIFSFLKCRSGCSRYSSWNRHFGIDITIYDSKFHGVNWIALGIHTPGHSGWSRCPNHFSGGTGLGARFTSGINIPDWFATAFIPPTPIKIPISCSSNQLNNSRAHQIPVDNSNPTSVNSTKININSDNPEENSSSLCMGLCSARVDGYSSVDANYCVKNWDYFRCSWRSKKCSLLASKEGGRCQACASDKSNLNRRVHPNLFSDPVMESTFPSYSSCDKTLKDLYESMSLEQFVADPTVTKIAKMMKLVIPDSASKPVVLANDARFVICEGGDASCLHYAVLGNKCQLLMCQGCKSKRSNDIKRAKRRGTVLASPEPDKRTKASPKYIRPCDG